MKPTRDGVGSIFYPRNIRRAERERGNVSDSTWKLVFERYDGVEVLKKLTLAIGNERSERDSGIVGRRRREHRGNEVVCIGLFLHRRRLRRLPCQ